MSQQIRAKEKTTMTTEANTAAANLGWQAIGPTHHPRDRAPGLLAKTPAGVYMIIRSDGRSSRSVNQAWAASEAARLKPTFAPFFVL